MQSVTIFSPVLSMSKNSRGLLSDSSTSYELRNLLDHDRHEDAADFLALGIFLGRNDEGSPACIGELHYDSLATHIGENLTKEGGFESNRKIVAVVVACDLLISCDSKAEILGGNLHLSGFEIELDVVGSLVGADCDTAYRVQEADPVYLEDR